jgi:hypothetical protein
MVDVEEDFYAEEMVKLRNDVERKGLSLVILAEWFNAKFIKKAACVFDISHISKLRYSRAHPRRILVLSFLPSPSPLPLSHV